MRVEEPDRGDIWFTDLSPTVGREQSGKRPSLVVSVDTFNHGPAELIVIVPLTSRRKGIPLHVKIDPPEGGLSMTSFAKCEDVRSISKARLTKKLGRVTAGTMSIVEDRLRVLIGL